MFGSSTVRITLEPSQELPVPNSFNRFLSTQGGDSKPAKRRNDDDDDEDEADFKPKRREQQ
jgi:hypothetical protein